MSRTMTLDAVAHDCAVSHHANMARAHRALALAEVEPQGTSFDNPIWHRRDWRIWIVGTDWAWAHVDADRDDDTDRRHGIAPSLSIAKSDINTYLDAQFYIDAQRSRA